MSGELDAAVAIVGMSCRFAGARTPEEYWANLRDGIESIGRYDDDDLLAAGVDPRLLRDPHYVRAGAPLADMECFDAALFGLSPRDAAIMDPQHRHFLECAWEALESAGHVPGRFAGAIGVFGGSGHNQYLSRNLLTNPRLVRDVGPFLLRHTGNDKDFLTTRASYLLDLKGPSVNVQTACSTSLVAVHMAIQSLLGGECDLALAGGASIDLPHRHGYLYEEGEILSPDGHCRPFDARSQGTVFGSGVGLVALRRLADAVADGDHVYAVVRGSAINNDGAGKVGYLAPSVDGQASVIAEALGVAGVDADSIGYVEAHGTGTPVGDPIEVAALTQAFRADTGRTGFCAIGSVKANIGHTDTAAGSASLIKVALALHHGALPPSLGYTAPNPACALERSPFTVNPVLTPWPRRAGTPRRAGVSSLGVGGTNAHVIVEEAPRRAPGDPSRPHQILTLSARSASALDANAAALAAHLARDDAPGLADAAWTLNVGRRGLSRRRIVIADTPADAATALADPGRIVTGEAIDDRGVAFMFCGAGSQYPGMGAELYRTEPVFRATVDECFAAMARLGRDDLARWLFPAPADAEQARAAMERPSLALPALFAVQVATARLWMSWGIRPAGMIGHSSGEYAAAHLAGVMGLDDALRIVATRGRLFETLPQGAMLSVPLSEAELRPLLPPDLSIAAVNGPSLCIASGGVDAIARLQDDLAARAIESQRVHIAVAAHSAMLDPILSAFRDCLAGVRLSRPTLPFVSNLTGAWITPAEATDPEYWIRHLRQTVRFTDGLQQLLADREQVLLEVGPGRTMASLARQHPGRDRAQPVANSLPHRGEAEDDARHLLTTLGRLWIWGAPVDWDAFWGDQRRLRVPLPTYRFDRTRHWIEPGAAIAADAGPDEPERRADIADWFFEPVWRRTPPARCEMPGGPALVFADRMGLADAIADRLRAGGRAVVTVTPGRGFARRGDGFVIDPGDPAGYGRLLAALAAEGRAPEQIHHCWLVTGDKRARDRRRDAATLQERGLYSLLFLTQALAEEDGGRAVRIAVVSDGMQRVADEATPHPAKATVLGACRTATREHGDLTVRSIDVTTPTEGVALLRLADLLIREIGGDDEADTVAIRAGERWVQTFEAAPQPATDADDGGCRLKAQGTYLITGGLGGIGLTIARHLAETCGARLALIGRTGLPPRDAWGDALASRPPGDPVRRRLREVLAIEAAGGEVLAIAADIADRHAMRRAVAAVHARFGRIDGVFHAAGVLDDELMQLKSRDAVAAVLAPKLYGTLALEAALAGDHPDFLLLFSSVSAFAGLVGQVDYAGANAFLDAYAQARRADPKTRVMSVGWSQWSEVGMVAAPSGATGGSAPPEPQGTGRALTHPFLRAAHDVAADEVIVTGSLSPETHWLLDEHRLGDGSALIPGTGLLEIARGAHAAIATGPAELRDVAFLAPFAVPDGASRDLRVRLRRDAGQRWRFGIHGRAPGEAAWTEHATGEIGAWRPSDETHLPLDAVRARCGRRAPDPAAIGGSPHLRFGPRWHNVRGVERGDAEALLHLELSAAFHGDLGELALHPPLLDFATAGAQMLIPGHDGHAFFAPLSYGRVRVRAPLPAEVWSHIRYRAGQGGGAVAVFDVTIADADGAVLVEIADFTMIRLRDAALLSAPPAPPVVAAATAQVDGDQGLTPREGVRVIERVLGGDPRPHLVVSPYDLLPALARLRAPRLAASVVPTGDMPDEAAPRTATERLIAEMWSDMLGVGPVRRDDSFFDLGGHSLLAVQFTNRLRKRTGSTLPLAALLETPTVERLAAVLDPPGAASAACGPPPPSGAADAETISGVVTIRAGGDGPALFLVHDGLGETLLYRNLALRLPDGLPVYGLEPERRPDGAFAHHTIAAMAAAHVARVRRVQPDGPYLLAGLCAGGVIAFEMARRLEDAGATVAFVGILDAADVAAPERRFRIMRARLERARGALTRMGGGGAPVLLRKAVNAARWEVTSRLERARRTRAVGRMAEPAVGAPALGFLQLYEVAHRQHRPQGRLSHGDVVLYRATAGNGAEEDIPFGEKYLGALMGWDGRVAGDIALVEVPGGHTSLLQDPHVATLAAALGRDLSRALETERVRNELVAA